MLSSKSFSYAELLNFIQKVTFSEGWHDIQQYVPTRPQNYNSHTWLGKSAK